MLMNIFRCVKGYVAFEGKGRFPERFLNLTVRSGVNLWDAQPLPGGLKGKLSLSDYRGIRPLARKAGLTLRVTERHGIPFLIARYRFRGGILVGAMLGAALLLFLSRFVWSVDIKGLSNVSASRLEAVLAENGLYQGRIKSGLDVNNVRRKTLLSVSELGWMSVNLDGCRAVVEVREKANKPPVNTHQNPRNVKAAADGVITDMRVHNGKSVVTEGSGVIKGELLISGVSDTEQNTVRYVCADAEVFANVNSKKEFLIPRSFDYYSLSENKSVRSRFGFLNLSLPAGFSLNNYNYVAYTSDEKSLFLNDRILPVTLSEETAHELECQKADLSQKQAEQAAENELALYEIFEKGRSTVVSKKLKVIPKNGEYSCLAVYTFNENIAKPVDFSVKEE